MKHRIALISLRFKPAFISLLAAFAKAFSSLSCEVELVLSDEYVRFDDLKGAAPATSLSTALESGRYTHAIFMNVSVQNRQLALSLKNQGTKIMYIYHEPWDSLAAHLRTEGLRATLTWAAAHVLSVPMLRLSDRVILPSNYGSSVYQRRDVAYNRNSVCVPLLFDDEASWTTETQTVPKEYFSYIGAICGAHAFDEFVSFMRFSLKENLGAKFLIASSMPLPTYLLRDSIVARNRDKLRICCGKSLTNKEINDCYAASVCIWSLYRRSTQSAVLPKAFMFGTPVLANSRGAFPEFIQEGFNGRFADSNDIRAIHHAFNDFKDNINEYAVNCRNTFLRTFFYRSNLGLLQQLLSV